MTRSPSFTSGRLSPACSYSGSRVYFSGMHLSKAIERVKAHAKDYGVRSALTQLADELREKVLPALLRSASRREAPATPRGTGSESEQPKYVFNISVAVAVGVPVNKAEGTPGDEGAGKEGADVHGEGAPAVATATVSALPSATGPKVAVKSTPPRKARAAEQKPPAAKAKGTRRSGTARQKSRA